MKANDEQYTRVLKSDAVPGTINDKTTQMDADIPDSNSNIS